MLTAQQCRTVAYYVDGSIVCPDCVKPTDDCSANELIEYSAQQCAGDDGLYCDECTKEIVEPTPRCDECEKLEEDCVCDEEDREDDDDHHEPIDSVDNPVKDDDTKE